MTNPLEVVKDFGHAGNEAQFGQLALDFLAIFADEKEAQDVDDFHALHQQRGDAQRRLLLQRPVRHRRLAQTTEKGLVHVEFFLHRFHVVVVDVIIIVNVIIVVVVIRGGASG